MISDHVMVGGAPPFMLSQRILVCELSSLMSHPTPPVGLFFGLGGRGLKFVDRLSELHHNSGVIPCRSDVGCRRTPWDLIPEDETETASRRGISGSGIRNDNLNPYFSLSFKNALGVVLNWPRSVGTGTCGNDCSNATMNVDGNTQK